MADYDPNGDAHERLMFYAEGHPEIWDPEKIRQFQRYLRDNLNTPVEIIRLRFSDMVGETAKELRDIADRFEFTE